MSGKQTRKITNWDNEPEKRIADRLAALYLFLQVARAQGVIAEVVMREVELIIESDNPKGRKYHYAAQLESYGEVPIEGPARCQAGQPDTLLQCGLPAGHEGDHTILIPSDAPWFPSLPNKQDYDPRDGGNEQPGAPSGW